MFEVKQNRMEFQTSPDAGRLDAGPAERTIGYKLRLAQIMAFQAFELRQTDHGAAPRYLGLLSVIRAHPGQPQSRLAEAVALQRSSLVRILDQLGGEGLIERRTSAEDRRVNGVWLTPKGEATVDELMARALRQDAAMARGFTDRETAQLLHLLDRLIGNLEAGEG